MTRTEYKQYLYDLFVRETDGCLHPKKAVFAQKHSHGDLSFKELFIELGYLGVEYEKQLTSERTLRRAAAFVLHSVASIMNRYHLSFEEAMDPKYHEERWALLLENNAAECHKNQLLGMTKEQLTDGVL